MKDRLVTEAILERNGVLDAHLLQTSGLVSQSWSPGATAYQLWAEDGRWLAFYTADDELALLYAEHSLTDVRRTLARSAGPGVWQLEASTT